MAVTEEQVRALRARVESLNTRRIQEEARAQQAEAEIARLAEEARQQFGVGTEEELAALLAHEEALLVEEVAALERAVQAAEQAAVAVPS